MSLEWVCTKNWRKQNAEQTDNAEPADQIWVANYKPKFFQTKSQTIIHDVIDCDIICSL